MEDKVTMTLPDFKEMYKETLEMENYIIELKKEMENLKEEYENIEKYVYNEIYSQNQYDLRNTETLDLNDYYFRNLIEAFRKHGYSNFERITELIKKMKLQFDSESNKDVI